MNNMFKKIIKHFLPLAIALCVIIVIDVNAQEVGMTTAEVTGKIISEKMQNPLDSSEENIIKGKDYITITVLFVMGGMVKLRMYMKP